MATLSVRLQVQSNAMTLASNLQKKIRRRVEKKTSRILYPPYSFFFVFFTHFPSKGPEDGAPVAIFMIKIVFKDKFTKVYTKQLALILKCFGVSVKAKKVVK